MTDPDGLRTFEGDSGGWQDSHARPRPKRKAAAPARSIARFRDFGASCRGQRSHCAGVTRKAADNRRVARRDFGSSCQDSRDYCRTVARNAKVKAYWRAAGYDPNDRRLKRALNHVAEHPEYSASICGQFSAAAVYGVATEACINFDEVGITYSRAEKWGWNTGIDVSASALFRLQNESAADVSRKTGERTVSVGATAGLGPYGGIEIERGTDSDAGSMTMKFGVGVSASVATMMTSTDVYNSGYLVRWEDLSWPEKPF